MVGEGFRQIQQMSDRVNQQRAQESMFAEHAPTHRYDRGKLIELATQYGLAPVRAGMGNDKKILKELPDLVAALNNRTTPRFGPLGYPTGPTDGGGVGPPPPGGGGGSGGGGGGPPASPPPGGDGGPGPSPPPPPGGGGGPPPPVESTGVPGAE